MEPSDLIRWAVCITVAVLILSVTGIQDWIATNILKKETKGNLKKKIKELEDRIEQLEASKKEE